MNGVQASDLDSAANAARRQPQILQLIEAENAVLLAREPRQPLIQVRLDVLRPYVGRFTSHPCMRAESVTNHPPSPGCP